jgi:hypothetical protein
VLPSVDVSEWAKKTRLRAMNTNAWAAAKLAELMKKLQALIARGVVL